MKNLYILGDASTTLETCSPSAFFTISTEHGALNSTDITIHFPDILSSEDWLVVEQGRQWQDEDGRHVLVMRPGGQVEELLLSAQSLRWELVPRRGLQII